MVGIGRRRRRFALHASPIEISNSFRAVSSREHGAARVDDGGGESHQRVRRACIHPFRRPSVVVGGGGVNLASTVFQTDAALTDARAMDAILAEMRRAQGIVEGDGDDGRDGDGGDGAVDASSRVASPAEEAAVYKSMQTLCAAFATVAATQLGAKWYAHFESWLYSRRASSSSSSSSATCSALDAFPRDAMYDTALARKLEASGASAAEAKFACAQIGKACARAMSKARGALETTRGTNHVRVRTFDVGDGGGGGARKVELACGKVKVEVNATHYAKLRAMYARTGGSKHVRDEEAFERAVFCVLARYASLQGTHYKAGNMQASIPPAVFDALFEYFDVSHEMFASPLNARCDTFCSASDATDRAFGSKGSAFDFLPLEGSFEANPPFDEGVIAALGAHLERVLSASKAPLSFCVIIPRWNDSQAWLRIAKSVYCTSNTTLEAKEHAFVSGGAGSRIDQLTASAAATSVLFLQNKAGAKKWPPTPDAIEAISRGFALPPKNHDDADEDEDARWDPDAPISSPSTRRRAAGQSSFVYGTKQKKRTSDVQRETAPPKKQHKKATGKFSASFFRDE